MSKEDFYKLFDFSEQECEDKEFWDKFEKVFNKHSKKEAPPPKKYFKTNLDSDNNMIDITGNISYMEGISCCLASVVELIAQAFDCDKEIIEHVSEGLSCYVREIGHIIASGMDVDYKEALNQKMDEDDIDE